MSRSGRVTLPDVRVWSGVPPGGPGVVGSNERFWFDSTKYPGVVGKPSRMSWSGRESLLDVWEWSGGPPG